MNKVIQVLPPETIDQIAAGEVIERPSSVVKELVENAVDAGAQAITVEIREGGISLIRVTDNGEGIDSEMIRTAFLRHATSKIRKAEDLIGVSSLGFRGEALSSICAVSQMELITRTADSLTGYRYCIEGGRETLMEEIGAPEGSTFLVKNLFYNTPARKKFLKSPVTEAGYVSELMEHLALSHPEVSFKFISSGQTKLHTSGNSNLRDVIYTVFGREFAANVLPIEHRADGLAATGFIGKPSLSRGNRNYENYFVNGRYIRSQLLSKAIEEGYGNLLMQHRYPFTVLNITIEGTSLDVNVHPGKLEVRFADQPGVYRFVSDTVRAALSSRELIPEVTPEPEKEVRIREKEQKKEEQKKAAYAPEPFEKIRRSFFAEPSSPYQPRYPDRPHRQGDTVPSLNTVPASGLSSKKETSDGREAPKQESSIQESTKQESTKQESSIQESTKQENLKLEKPQQQSLFEDNRLLSAGNRKEHRIIGQIFDTYWIVQFKDHMYLIDQHAAHEKVMYERLCKKMEQKEQTSQQVSPPIVISLSMKEEILLNRYLTYFHQAGFSIEHFGGREYTINAVPDNLYGFTDKELFTEMLDSLSDLTGTPRISAIYEKLASMACKAAIKGNHTFSVMEADALIDELLTLDDPYNCPHGRPTIISMSRTEIEKKFKR